MYQQNSTVRYKVKNDICKHFQTLLYCYNKTEIMACVRLMSLYDLRPISDKWLINCLNSEIESLIGRCTIKQNLDILTTSTILKAALMQCTHALRLCITHGGIAFVYIYLQKNLKSLYCEIVTSNPFTLIMNYEMSTK